MKNFDAERAQRRRGEDERTFQLGGQTFLLRSAIHPSVLDLYDALDPAASTSETMKIVDDMIVAMLDPRDDAEARYHQVRENRDDPISVEDLQDLVRWMVEVQSGRPTGPPEDSSSGPQPTVTSLMGGSFSADPTET